MFLVLARSRASRQRCFAPMRLSRPSLWAQALLSSGSLGFLSQTENGNFLRRNHFSQARPVHDLVLCVHPHLRVPFSLKGALIAVGDTEDLALEQSQSTAPVQSYSNKPAGLSLCCHVSPGRAEHVILCAFHTDLENLPPSLLLALCTRMAPSPAPPRTEITGICKI